MNPAQLEKLDCHARVITPENVEFEYALAGPFQRLPAFVLDFAVRFFFFLALFFAASMFSAFTNLGGAFIFIVAALAFFLLSWFYGIFFESRFNGRTLGKMVFKLRVISTDGRPINATQAALRNFLRLADMCVMLPLQIFAADNPPAFVIPTMSVGLVVMTCSPRLQRLGDLAAATMVVSEQVRSTPWNLQPEDVRAYGLAELIPANYAVSRTLAQTIGLYMENRNRLGLSHRNELAKHLADPLIRQFELLPDTGPDLLLCALYVRTFQSAEQQQAGVQRLRQLPTGQTPVPPTLPVSASTGASAGGDATKVSGDAR